MKYQIINIQFLYYCRVNDKVRLTPQGKVYRVKESNNYAPTIEDIKTGKVIDKSPWINVYLLKESK